MPQKMYPIISQPGIKRDGTNFAGRNYTEGQWCRFRGGYPRKMGGYRQIYGALPENPTGIFMTSQVPDITICIGSASYLNHITMNQFGGMVDIQNRTPAGFSANGLNVWQFDEMFSTTSDANYIIAHAAPNLGDTYTLGIDNDIEAPVYYGVANSNDLFESTGQSVSGGIAVLHPYLFIFGNNGYIQWSEANNPTSFPTDNSARVTSQKIVAGLATRGGNSSPAGLFWSLDSLIRVTDVGSTTTLFKFDTVTNQSSILSSRSIIEYDGIYFWAGVDRFLMYNGIVQEVPNSMNLQFFYYNDPAYVNRTTTPQYGYSLNYSYRQNVWATKIPQYGEIWWFYPSLNSTSGECDRAIIFNKRENTWYDTDLPVDSVTTTGGRGAGYFEQVFSDPVWAGNTNTGTNLAPQYILWQHETGVNKNINGALTAIESYFKTCDIAWCAVGPDERWTGLDRWVDLQRVEPDFIQVGELLLTVSGEQYAGQSSEDLGAYFFESGTDKIDMRHQAREMRLQFTSDTVGGFYEMGQTLAWFRIGDERA